ncbi:MAG: DUF305 domain-containing protein [Terriglobales bacterium]
MKKLLPWAVFAVAAALSLGCHSSSASQAASSAAAANAAAPVPEAVVQPGAPGQASTVIADKKVPAFNDPSYTQADVDFMQGMIYHHTQALEMVALIASHTQNQKVSLLGDKIRIAQSQDITAMRVWLTQRGQALPAMVNGVMTLEGKPMPLMMGMLSPQQMKTLTAARGATFDRLFLTYMIQHHTGALQMVGDLRNHANSGLEPNIADFATAVYTDQTVEINRMEGLLGRTGK